MASPQVNTKLERTAEAIEDLAVAVVAAHGSRPAAGAFDNVVNARKELRDALGEFLAPTLRLVPKMEEPISRT